MGICNLRNNADNAFLQVVSEVPEVNVCEVSNAVELSRIQLECFAQHHRIWLYERQGNHPCLQDVSPLA